MKDKICPVLVDDNRVRASPNQKSTGIQNWEIYECARGHYSYFSEEREDTAENHIKELFFCCNRRVADIGSLAKVNHTT